MRCQTFGFRTTGPFEIASGQMFGANVAEQALAAATLEQNHELIWEVLTAGSVVGKPGLVPYRSEKNAEPWSGRVRLRDIQSFPNAADADSVLIANPPTFSRASILRNRAGLPTVPVCSLVHSVWTADFPIVYTGCLLLSQPADSFIASSAAAKTALNGAFDLAAELLERSAHRTGREEIPRPRVVSIPFGVTVPDESALDRVAARRLLQLPAEVFVVLYLGRISEAYKADLAPLLMAVRHLEACGKGVHLLVAGQALEPEYTHRFRIMVENCGLDSRVILLENFPDFLKSSLYAAADVCVSPVDSIQESFGLSVLEAMAHSRPVIASNWSGYRDLVEDGATGFLVDILWSSHAAQRASQWAFALPSPTAAHHLSQHTVLQIEGLLGSLRLLAGDPELGRRMGRAGRIRAKSLFAWPLVADQFLTLWNSQIIDAKQLQARNESASGLDSIFAHYASGVIEPSTLVARLANTEEIATLELLHAFGHPQPERVHSLIAATAMQPVSIGELELDGFTLADILWIAKKGFRRLLPLESLGEWEV